MLSLSLHWESRLYTGSGHFRLHIPNWEKSQLESPSQTPWNLPELWHLLEMPLNFCQFLFSLPISPLHLIPQPGCPLNPLTHPVPSLHPPLMSILLPFWERLKHPSLGSLFYLASLYVWIVAWLSCILWLISTYKWVHTMHVLLGLRYLTQDDILKFHLFAIKIHGVFVFDSWIVFHCVDCGPWRRLKTPQEDQQSQLTWTLGALRDLTTDQRAYTGWT